MFNTLLSVIFLCLIILISVCLKMMSKPNFIFYP